MFHFKYKSVRGRDLNAKIQLKSIFEIGSVISDYGDTGVPMKVDNMKRCFRFLFANRYSKYWSSLTFDVFIFVNEMQMRHQNYQTCSGV